MEPYLPFTADRDTGPFFAALDRGELTYLGCDDCGSAIHPPTRHCPACGSWKTEWKTAAGTGTLYSYTVVHHQVHPAYPTPYSVVLVEVDGLQPPVRLVGYLPGAPRLTIGMPMRVRYQRVAVDTTIAQWDPA